MKSLRESSEGGMRAESSSLRAVLGSEGVPMSAPAIKPGTRCECNDVTRAAEHDSHPLAHPENITSHQCTRDAVRLVTVERIDGADAVGFARFRDVPMCSPCAAHAEKARGEA